MNVFLQASLLCQRLDESAADDGSPGMVTGLAEGFIIVNTKADHTRITQFHLPYALEIIGVGHRFSICAAGCGSRRNHINKTIGVAW